MNIKEAAGYLSEYSSTNGSGRCTDKQHNEAKAIAVRVMKEYDTLLKDILADIEKLPKTYPFYDHMDTYVKTDDVRNIILSRAGNETDSN